MEKLGFEKQEGTKLVQYTYLDELVENYFYVLTKERYLSLNESIKKK